MPMRSKNHNTTIWVGWLISILFVCWAVIKMDFGEVWGALSVADYTWIIPAAIINLAILILRGVRWREFIIPTKKITRKSAVSALCIGFMANMVLPARLGELVRAYILAKRENIAKSTSLGTVVIERAFDGLSVVVMVALIFLFASPPGESEFWSNLKLAGLSAPFFFIAFFVGMLSFYKQVRIVVWVIDFMLRLLPDKNSTKLTKILGSFRQGFDSLNYGHHLRNVVLWSFVIWGLAGPYNYFFFLAFGQELPFSACFVVLMVQMFGVMIPSGPGFIGVYHAATIAGLMFYGVDAELALSMALVIHVVMFVMQTIPGLLFLWLEQYSFRDIAQAADQQ